MLDVDNMKYIPLRSFEDVSAALNLEKHGFLMEGSCDLYSVKCVGDEKKLYKKIHEDLNAQHQRNIKEAAGMPKEFSSSFRESANLSRASPFGSLTNSGNRRKYAHLIAVLNATHSDHDFSNVLRPDDFVRIRSLDDAVTDIDHKIYDANSSKIPSGSQTPGGSALWNPKMWNTIDDEMDLRDCEIYQYKPLDDPFAEDGDSAFWDMHYFFLNVNRKSLQRRSDGKGKVVLRYVNNSRCCYLYLRATRQPVYYGWNNAAADEEYEEEVGKAGVHNVKRRHSVRESADFSASKRARYWFGDQVGDVEDYFYHKPDDHDDEGGFEGDDYDLCMLEAMRRGRDSNSAHSPEVVG
ncbi:Maf1-domain-containing protein [Tothia fuscella]|uniref:Maf1-domain-containing protein n=1 Tax=Tothia fuscella TaxID=1048955 RepID=A0A9P4NLC2_9PEZI|nr:Maf1-domain-containing protein [Tothia fuscella]